MRASPLSVAVVAAALAASCADLVGADFGDYARAERDGGDDDGDPVDSGSHGEGGRGASTGGRGSGGKASTAGKPGSGGTVAAGGRSGTGGAGVCPAGQKACAGGCTPPNPRVGCGLTLDCRECPSSPPNSYPFCDSGACHFACVVGFHLNAAEDGCVAGQGGAGGSNPGAGGAPSAGGNPGSGGACPSGQKTCGGECVTPNPGVGCGATGCAACPAPPANAFSACSGEGACYFDCLLGYRRNAACDGCEVDTGTGGAECSAAPCKFGNDETGCLACSPVQGKACCTTAGACGCQVLFIPGTCQ